MESRLITWGEKPGASHVKSIHATTSNSVSEIVADEMALRTILFSPATKPSELRDMPHLGIRETEDGGPKRSDYIKPERFLKYSADIVLPLLMKLHLSRPSGRFPQFVTNGVVNGAAVTGPTM